MQCSFDSTLRRCDFKIITESNRYPYSQNIARHVLMVDYLPPKVRPRYEGSFIGTVGEGGQFGINVAAPNGDSKDGLTLLRPLRLSPQSSQTRERAKEYDHQETELLIKCLENVADMRCIALSSCSTSELQDAIKALAEHISAVSDSRLSFLCMSPQLARSLKVKMPADIDDGWCLNSAKIVCSNVIPYNTIWALPAPEYTGVLALRDKKTSYHDQILNYPPAKSTIYMGVILNAPIGKLEIV